MRSVLIFSILTPITGGEVIVRNPNLWPGTMANCKYLANPQGFQQDRDRSSSVHGLNLNAQNHSLGLLFVSWSLDILPMFNVYPQISQKLQISSDFTAVIVSSTCLRRVALAPPSSTSHSPPFTLPPLSSASLVKTDMTPWDTISVLSAFMHTSTKRYKTWEKDWKGMGQGSKRINTD